MHEDHHEMHASLHDLHDGHHTSHESVHLKPALHRDHQYYEPTHAQDHHEQPHHQHELPIHNIHEAPHLVEAHAPVYPAKPAVDAEHLEQPHVHEDLDEHHKVHAKHHKFAEKIEGVDRTLHREHTDLEGEHLCRSSHFCHSFSHFAKQNHANAFHYSHMVATYFVVPDSLVVHEDAIHAKLHLHVHELYSNAVDYRANHLDLNLALFQEGILQVKIKASEEEERFSISSTGIGVEWD